MRAVSKKKSTHDFLFTHAKTCKDKNHGTHLGKIHTPITHPFSDAYLNKQ